VRFVSKEVLVKGSSRSARGSVLGALAEDMGSGPTEHTPREADRVTTLKVGDGIEGKGDRAVDGSRLVSLHGLLGWRHESARKGGDIIRWLDRRGGKGNSGRNGGDGERSGKGRGGSGFELTIDGLGNQAFLATEESVVSDSGHTKETQSSKLGGTGEEGRKVGRSIQGVNLDRFLEVRGKGIKKLGN
jgi:hypothetical protein